MTIIVGTCGFSYRDWIGPFYPLGIKSGDMLPYYAERFPAVEIDSTYYAIPKPQLFERMVARTPSSFTFTVKAPGSVTHVPADGDPIKSEIKNFADCLVPLVSSGKLGALLAQFPHSFRPGEDAYRRLEMLAEHWSFAPIVCEFRHREWQDGDKLERLRELGLGWCNVDEPVFSSLMRPSADATSQIGYIRFHGRNYEKWWRQERASHERYSYDYSEPELERWLPRITQVAEQTEKTFVFFNNHHLGKAATNALTMRRILMPLTGDISPIPPVGEQAQTKLF
ncbi:MAG TPA: DUF72 domain-containing protein [Candidatus Binatus sp.]|nr:DUF72 domain-containing protein [Candidatus Binatus sp.]